MKLFKWLVCIVAAGVVSVLAVQLFYRHIYRKWNFYTLFDHDIEPD